MLGRLATWLRLIGQDATYGSQLCGRALVRHARREGRTILTRDRRLVRDPHSPPVVFIAGDDFRVQLRQAVDHFHLDPFADVFTRCARCNKVLCGVAAAAVADCVPPYVLATQQRFARCPHCRRVYWSATHADRIRSELVALGFPPPPH